MARLTPQCQQSQISYEELSSLLVLENSNIISLLGICYISNNILLPFTRLSSPMQAFALLFIVIFCLGFARHQCWPSEHPSLLTRPLSHRISIRRQNSQSHHTKRGRYSCSPKDRLRSIHISDIDSIHTQITRDEGQW